MTGWTLKHWIGSALILVGTAIMTVLFIKQQVILGLMFAFIPIVLIVFFFALDNPYWGLLILFAENYFLMGLTRYVYVSGIGVLTDALILFILFSALIRTIHNKDVDWKRALNGGSLLLSVWLLFCVFEIANSTAITGAWISSFRSLTFYPLAVVILTSIIFKNYKSLKTILLLYAVFTLFAVAKLQMQKSIGFDNYEWRWLMEGENSSTHLLSSGTRYFSFFTDAGNFGSNMGFAMVVFTIAALYVKDKWTRIFYAATGFLGMYAMFVSGTRGAIAVPFAGFFLFTILSKKIKVFVASILFLGIIFSFFMFTNIGQGNQYIRRMRSAFDPNEPSLMVRLENQKRLAQYIKTRPFGEGIGLSGVAAKRFDPNRLTTNIPNDSWYVKVWVETGLVGLLLFISIQMYFIIYGGYLVFYKIKNKELKGIVTAMICGIFGVMVSSYGNAFYGQYPTCILVSMMQAFIIISPHYDKEIESSIIKIE